MNLKELCIILILITLGKLTFGQLDSSYLLLHDKFNISTYTIVRNFDFKVEDDLFQTQSIGIGFRLKYKMWGIAATLPIIIKNEWTDDNLTSFGYNYDYFHQRNSFHLISRHYWEGENIFDLPKLDDFQFTFINVRWTHVLSKNFSYRSSYRMFEQQLKSNGGFSFSTDIFYHYLPDELYNQLENNHLFQTRLSLGYTYIYVWKRNYFATIHGSTGISSHYNSKNQQPFNIDYQPLSNVRSAIGFQNKKFGVSLFYNYTVNDFKVLQLKSENSYWGWLLNFRV